MNIGRTAFVLERKTLLGGISRSPGAAILGHIKPSSATRQRTLITNMTGQCPVESTAHRNGHPEPFSPEWRPCLHRASGSTARGCSNHWCQICWRPGGETTAGRARHDRSHSGLFPRPPRHPLDRRERRGDPVLSRPREPLERGGQGAQAEGATGDERAFRLTPQTPVPSWVFQPSG